MSIEDRQSVASLGVAVLGETVRIYVDDGTSFGIKRLDLTAEQASDLSELLKPAVNSVLEAQLHNATKGGRSEH